MVASGPSMHNDTVIIIMWEEKFMIIKGTSKKQKICYSENFLPYDMMALIMWVFINAN